MKKKQMLSLIIGSLILIISPLLLIREGISVDRLRVQHSEFLKNHEFQKLIKLNRKERISRGLPPNPYLEYKYLSEINPVDGLVHKENIFNIQKKLDKERRINKEVDIDSPGGENTPWIERGPDNVGGRTRAIIFDPNDPTKETVFAGGVSGGLWKNTNISDSNSKWERIGIPENLAVSCIAVDPNNSKIFYVGTGESYVDGDVNGNGVWKSTDGGSTWTHIFGGSTGKSFLDTGTSLVVNSPTFIAGRYTAVIATFGGELNDAITGDLVLVDDGEAPTNDACENILNAENINGKIAVIKRGSCNFDDKVVKAQNSGAIAVIMVNNISGDPIAMGGDDSSITIPALMISLEDGNSLISSLGSTVNITIEKSEGIGVRLVPGVHHINDIVVRNINGQSEVYVAAGESGYFSSSNVAIIGGDSFGLYKSTDGSNFTQINLPSTSNGNKYEPNNIEIAANNSIYLSTINSRTYQDGGGCIFHSFDGNNFALKHKVSGGLRTEISLSSFNENIGYILVQTSEDPVKIYKTTDGFSTVNSVSLPNDADTDIPANDFTRGQAFYNLIIKVDPNNDDIVYVGGIDLFKSLDGGNSWSQLTHWYGGFNFQEVHEDQHGIAFASSQKLLFSNDGGVYYSSNSGANIQARNNNFNTLQFYTVGVAPMTAFGGDEYFLAGAQDNGTQLIAKASDGINSSINVSGGDGAASFFDLDGTDRYFVTNYVYNSSIGFFNYDTGSPKLINSEEESNGDFINQADLDSNLNILYTNYSVGNMYRLRRYSDLKGDVLKTILTDPIMNASPSVIKVSPYTSQSSKLYLGLKNGKLLVVSDANTVAQWIEITGDEFVGSISDIEFGRDENEIFVTMHNYGVQNIWYSDDGGISWSAKEGNFPDIPVKTILQNPLNREEVIIGTDIGVWKTSNFMAISPEWFQSYNGMSNVPVLDLDLRDDNTVFAATYGRGIFSGKFTGVTASIKDVDNQMEDFTIFPTISDGNFTVYGDEKLKGVELQIYSLKGQKVYNKQLDFTIDKKIDIKTSLSSGIYLVNIIDSKNRKRSRRIIVK